MALPLALLVMQQLTRLQADAVTNLFSESWSQPWDNWAYGYIHYGIDPQHIPTCGWKVILSSSHPLCYVQSSSWDATAERLNDYTFVLTNLPHLNKPLNHTGALYLYGPFGNTWPSIIANYYCVCNALTSGNCQNVAHETVTPTGSTLSNMSCPGVEVITTPWPPATSLSPSPATGVSTYPTITLPSAMPNSQASTTISSTPTSTVLASTLLASTLLASTLLASTLPPSHTTPPSTSTLAPPSTYMTPQPSLFTLSSIAMSPTSTLPTSTTLSELSTSPPTLPTATPLSELSASSPTVPTATTQPTLLTSSSTPRSTTKAWLTSTSSSGEKNSNSKCVSNLHMARLENTCYTGASHTTLSHIRHFVDCCSYCCSYSLCESVNFRPLTDQCDIIFESTNGTSNHMQFNLGCQYWVVKYRS